MSELEPCCSRHDDYPADADWCSAKGRGQLCTRPDGHDGPHVACSVYEHCITSWTDDDSDDQQEAAR